MKNDYQTTLVRTAGGSLFRVAKRRSRYVPDPLVATRSRHRKQKHWSSAAILAESRLFVEYQQALAATTGLALELRCAHPKKDVRATAPGLRKIRVPVRYGNRVMAFLETAAILAKTPGATHGPTGNGGGGGPPATTNAEVVGATAGGIRPLTPEQFAGITHLLAIFSRQLADWFVRHAASDPRRSSIREFRAREWIEAHFHEPITLNDAAAAMNLSICYFSKRFLAMTGTNFREFLWRTRVAHAKRLLADPQLSIFEAANAVGFGSISQFGRIFRRIVGQSAGEFRADIQARPNSTPDSVMNSPTLRSGGDSGSLARLATGTDGFV